MRRVRYLIPSMQCCIAGDSLSHISAPPMFHMTLQELTACISGQNVNSFVWDNCVTECVQSSDFSSFGKLVVLPSALQKQGNAVRHTSKKWVASNDSKHVYLNTQHIFSNFNSVHVYTLV